MPFVFRQSNLVSESVKRAHSIEEESKILRGTVSTLQSTLEISEAQRAAECDSRKKAEAQVERLTSLLERSKIEASKLASNSSLLRTEGRNVKKHVVNTVSLLKELMGLVRTDAASVGIDMPTALRSSSSSFALGEATGESLNLIESLGISDLIAINESFPAVLSWTKETLRTKKESTNSLRALREETLKRKDSLNVEDLTSKVASLSMEKDRMTAQIALLKGKEREGEELRRQVAELNTSLGQEKKLKETAMSQLKLLQSSVSKNTVVVDKPALGSNGDEQLRRLNEDLKMEMSVLSREKSSLRLELKAANHHREVLRDGIEQLEKQLKTTVDALAEAKVQSHHHPSKGGAGKEEMDSLRRQNVRYKVRAVALDEVVTTYRRAILSLQHYSSSDEKEGRNSQSQSSSQLSHEMTVLKRCYEEEVSLLEAEVNELYGKLSQAEVYSQEIKRQFEENLKASTIKCLSNFYFRFVHYIIFYLLFCRSGRGVSSSGEAVTLQLEQARGQLNNAVARVKELEAEAASERRRSRKRTNSLSEELQKAMRVREVALDSFRRLEVSLALLTLSSEQRSALQVHYHEIYGLYCIYLM